MRRRWSFISTVLLCLAATPGAAQKPKPPKVDSLLVHFHGAKPAALDATVNAFMQAGLTVTNTTNVLVESDQGKTTDTWLTGNDRMRVVRAILYGSDTLTNILIIGDEKQEDRDRRSMGQLRIDNRAGGNGGKVWRKMISAALALDSSAVPPEAKPEYVAPPSPDGNCAVRMGGKCVTQDPAVARP